MMAMSSQNTEEAISWFRDVQAARKEMRLNSNTLPVLRLGLLRIDAIYWKRVEKVLHMRPDLQRALEASMTEST